MYICICLFFIPLVVHYIVSNISWCEELSVLIKAGCQLGRKQRWGGHKRCFHHLLGVLEVSLRGHIKWLRRPLPLSTLRLLIRWFLISIAHTRLLSLSGTAYLLTPNFHCFFYFNNINIVSFFPIEFWGFSIFLPSHLFLAHFGIWSLEGQWQPSMIHWSIAKRPKHHNTREKMVSSNNQSRIPNLFAKTDRGTIIMRPRMGITELQIHKLPSSQAIFTR
jgi:hypothetical protein